MPTAFQWQYLGVLRSWNGPPCPPGGLLPNERFASLWEITRGLHFITCLRTAIDRKSLSFLVNGLSSGPLRYVALPNGVRPTRFALAWAYAMKQMYPQALAEFDKIADQDKATTRPPQRKTSSLLAGLVGFTPYRQASRCAEDCARVKGGVLPRLHSPSCIARRCACIRLPQENRSFLTLSGSHGQNE